MSEPTHYKVSQIGAAKVTTPWGESWRQHRSQVFPVGHPRLAYFLRTGQFHCDPIHKPVPGSAAVKAVEKVVVPETPAPVPKTIEVPPTPAAKIKILSVKELKRLNKTKLTEYAQSIGLDHVTEDGFTATEIRAEIDKLR